MTVQQFEIFQRLPVHIFRNGDKFPVFLMLSTSNLKYQPISIHEHQFFFIVQSISISSIGYWLYTYISLTDEEQILTFSLPPVNRFITLVLYWQKSICRLIHVPRLHISQACYKSVCIRRDPNTNWFVTGLKQAWLIWSLGTWVNVLAKYWTDWQGLPKKVVLKGY